MAKLNGEGGTSLTKGQKNEVGEGKKVISILKEEELLLGRIVCLTVGFSFVCRIIIYFSEDQ
jgi:hypothetical protein